MKWKKLGLIFKPGRYTWMVSYAQNPFAECLSGDRYRVYYAGRDKSNRARGGWVDFDLKDPKKILDMSQEPFLDLGDLGAFDDSGIMPSCTADAGGKRYMYYTGWSQAVAVPFTFYIGLMVQDKKDGPYSRYSQAPVLGRTKDDPYLTCSPWVIVENGVWKMWYVSATGWSIAQNDVKPKHYYHIRYAESADGIEWKANPVISIDFRKGEYAIARPTVYKEDGLYKMWYCFRGGYDTYRAGYAESKDGIHWTRKDGEAGIDVSTEGWDSEMICYPFVFKHGGNHYMLYNGNDFGRTGIGLAILEK